MFDFPDDHPTLHVYGGDADEGDTGFSGSHNLKGVSVGLSVGARLYFSEVLGGFARVFGSWTPLSGAFFVRRDTVEVVGQATGTAFAFGGDLGLRVGPFTPSFPLFLAVGATFCQSTIDLARGDDTFDSLFPGVGGVADLGVALLEEERLEITAGARVMNTGNWFGVALGWAML